jgi:hypothetical protein
MKLTTDDEHGRQYMAFCVGHMRGILEGVEDKGEDKGPEDKGV